MGRIEVEAILTTTQPVEAYGGIQLDVAVLEQMAVRMRERTIPLHFEHDPRRPWDANVLEAGVRERPDGYHEAWARLDIDEDEWNEWNQHLDEVGTAGGMSFTMTTDLASFGVQTATPFPIDVAADAAHFGEEATTLGALKLAKLGPTSANQLYQFNAGPIALVVISFASELLTAVPANLIAGYLLEAVKSFLRFNEETPTVFQLNILEGENHRRIEAFLETESNDVAKTAIETFGQVVSQQPGKYEYRNGAWQELPSTDGTQN